MKKFFVLGLNANAQHGKDTAANIINNSIMRRSSIETYAFAKPFKDALQIMLNFSHEQLYGSLKTEIDATYGVTPRVAMTSLGTEWGRNMINQDIWLIRANQEIEKAIDNGHDGIIITDVRYDNEAEMIRQWDNVLYENGSDRTRVTAKILKIVAPNIAIDHEMYQHSSEMGIHVDERDYEVINPYDTKKDATENLTSYADNLEVELKKMGIC